MSVRIVRLGSPRLPGEGLRIGTVRRPPRGVPKSEFAARDYYDVWLPQLSPSPELVAEAQNADTASEWNKVMRRFKKEMASPDNNHLLDLLAKLSQVTDFSVGCYCENEAHCHRGTLRVLLAEKGARVVEEGD